MLWKKEVCIAAMVVLIGGLSAVGQEILYPNDDVTTRGSSNYNASAPFGLFVKGSSDVSYLEFDFGSIAVRSAILTLHNDDAGVTNPWEIVVRGEKFDFDETIFTGTDVSGWGRVGTISGVMDIAFYSLDMTSFYNDNLGEKITLQLGRDSQPGGSGPIFEDREGTKTGDSITFGPQLKIVLANQAWNPDPPHEGTNVLPMAKLSWDPPNPSVLADPNHVTYDVWFGTEPNSLSPNHDFNKVSPSQSKTDYDPSGLDLNTRYYWQIDVIDPNFGDPVPMVYTGEIWYFNTIPPRATDPDPFDGATNVAQNAILSWTAGFGAISHNVYISAIRSEVENGTAPMVNVTENTYDPDLDWETEYFWCVDEVFADGGDPEQGDIWSFTISGIRDCEEPLLADLDNNCIVDIYDFALMSVDWLTCNLINGDCP